MKNLLRRLRGLLGVGITWGAAWSGIGAVIGAVVGIVWPDVWAFGNPVLDWAVGMGLYGLVSGAGFAGLLSLGEGRKTLRQLSLGRVAIWGVLGSALVPLGFGAVGAFVANTTWLDILQAMVVTGGLGGVFAPGTVALAKRAELGSGGGLPLLEEGEE